MKKSVILLLVAVLITFSMLIGCSKGPKFKNYGVFISGINGFQEAKEYSWSSRADDYADSKSLNNSSPIRVEGDVIIYVYSPKVKSNDFRLLTDPKLNNYSGNINCGNWSMGHKCNEVEMKTQPVEGSNDTIKITASSKNGIFILHDRTESKGYIFKIEVKK